MNKKIVFIAVAILFLVIVHRVEAQQPKKIPRIGYVSGSGDASNPGPLVEAFRQGLRDLGYTEGKNVLVEYRYAEGKLDRTASLVAELVQLEVDVVVVAALPGILAAKQATKTIPIVMVTSQDPVAAGLVDSLARPGGNITGLTRLTRELRGKRLELLKEVIPRMSRVGVLVEANTTELATPFKDYETAASALKIPLQSLEVRGPNPDFEKPFQAAAKARLSALIAVNTSLLNRYPERIADLAIKYRLPSMYEASYFVEAGGLMSYSSNEAAKFKRAAYYVDKILKGARPAGLPVEQPMKFELVINLKTAKQIGLTIPPNVLARADKVIR
jgi:putative tryptophan/tyrosine transport system substrate-binding protein